jgi:hypothetical protein
MLVKIEKTAIKLFRKVSNTVKTFADFVKDEFFDIYDKVVGHSYWPDTIDEIIDYTPNLYLTEKDILKFSDKILSIFKDLQQRLPMLLKSIDTEKLFSDVGLKIGGAVIGGILLATGSLYGRLAGGAYLSSILSPITSGISEVLSPTLLEFAGKSASMFFKEFIDGAINSFDKLLGVIPAFFDGLAKAVLPLPDFATDIIFSMTALNSTLITSAMALTAAYALFAKKGFDDVKDFIFGKEPKKKIKTRQEGLIDYIKPVFIPEATPDSDLMKNFKKAFSSPKLAQAAAVAFSTAFLESISLIEASIVGIPLLAYAIMGKDGGAKVTRNVLFLFEGILSTLYKATAARVTASLGEENILAKILNAPLKLFEKSIPKAKGRLTIAFEELSKDVVQMLNNLNTNASAFAKNKMTFMEAAVTSPQTNWPKMGPKAPAATSQVPIKGRLQTVLNEALSYDFGKGNSVKSVFDNNIKPIIESFKELKDKIVAFKFKEKILDITSNIFGTISKIISESFKLMADGVRLLGVILQKSKVWVFAGIVATFSATASATTMGNDALLEFSGTLGQVILRVTQVTTALMALGLAYRGLSKFSKARESFVLSNVASEMAILEPALRARSRRSPEGKYGQFRSKEAMDSDYQKYAADARATLVEKFSKDPLGTKEGLNAVKKDFNSLWDSVTKRADVVKGYLQNTILNKLWWRTGFTTIGEGFSSLFAVTPELKKRTKEANKYLAYTVEELIKGNFLKAFGYFLPGIIDFVSANVIGVGQIIKNITQATLKFSKLLPSLKSFGDIFKAIGLAATFAGKAIMRWIITPLSAFLIPALSYIAGWVALLTGAGVLGIYLFGEGDTFLDKLKTTYDLLRSMVGLDVTTNVGKKETLKKTLPSQIVGNIPVSFSSKISGLNYEKMSDVQYKVIQEAANTTKESLEQLNTLFIKQGGYTEENIKEQETLISDFNRLLDRMPQKEELSIQADFSQFQKDILAVDNSYWALTKRMLGATDMAQSAGNAVERTSSLFLRSIDSMGKFFTNIWEMIKVATIGGITAFAIGLPATFGAAIALALAAIYKIFYYLFPEFSAKLEVGVKTFGSKVLNFFGEMFDNWIKFFKDKVDETLHQFDRKPSPFQRAISEGQYIKNPLRMNKALSDLPNSDANTGIDFSRKLDLSFVDALPKDAQDAVKAVEETYKAAADRLNELNSREGDYAKMSLKRRQKYSKEVYEAYTEFMFQQEKFFTVTNALNPLGEQIKASKGLSERVEKLGGELKTAFDVDLGDKFKDGLINEKDATLLEKYVNDFNELNAKTRTVQSYGTSPKSIEELSGINIAKAAITRQVKNFEETLKLKSSLEIDLKLANDGELVKKDIDSITNKLQDISGTQLDSKTLRLFSPEEFSKVASMTDELTKKSLEYKKTLIYEKPFEEQIKALKMMQAEISKVNAQLEISSKKKQIEMLQEGSAGLSQYLETTGQQMPDVVASKGAFGKYAGIEKMRLEGELKQKEALRKANEAAEMGMKIPLESLGYQAGAQMILKSGKLLEKLTDTTITNLDTILGKFGDLGSSITTDIFAKFDIGSRRSLIDIGVKIKAIDDQLEEASARKASDKWIESLIRNKAALLETARVLLVENITKSGKMILESLARVSVSENETVVLLSRDILDGLIGLDSKIEKARAALNESTSISDFTENARLLQKELDKLKDVSAILELKTAFANSTRDGLIEGAKAGFERFKSLAGDTKLEFKDFMRLDGTERRASIDKLSAIDQLNKLAELPNLTEEQVAILEKFTEGADPKTVVTEMMANLDRSLLDKLKTPAEKSVIVQEEIRDQLKRMHTFSVTGKDISVEKPKLQGDTPILSPTEVVGTSDTIQKPSAQTSGDFYKVMADTIEKEQNDKFKSILNNTVGNLNKLKLVFTHYGQSFGEEWRNASDEQAKQAIHLVSNIGEINKLLDNELLSDEIQKQLKKSVDDYNSELGKIQEKLNEVSMKKAAEDAGKAFSSDVSSGFKDGIKDLVKGKSTFKEFTAGMLDKVTGSITDTFIEGLTKPLTEKAGGMISDLGKGVFSAGSATFSSLFGDKSFSESFSETFGKYSDQGVSANTAETVTVLQRIEKILQGQAAGDAMSKVASLFKGSASGVNAAFDSAGFAGVVSNAGTSLSNISKESSPLINGFGKSGVANAFEASSFRGITDEIGVDFKNSMTEVVRPDGDIFTTLGKSFSGIFDSIGGLFKSGGPLGGIGDLFSKGLGGLQDLGGGIMKLFTSFGFADGGRISGPGTGTSDSIMAMVSNGEFVVNAKATKEHLGLLQALNSGKTPKFATGGLIGDTSTPVMLQPNMVDIKPVTSANAGSQQVINLTITGDISRQTKAEIYKMLPNIAEGVNNHNKERGHRR